MAEGAVAKMKQMLADVSAMWEERWAVSGQTRLSPWQRLVRFGVFVVRSFGRNRCPMRAASLAYSTLLALVPLFAVAISISTSLLKTDQGREHIQQLINTVIAKVAPQLDLTTNWEDNRRGEVVETIHSSIQKVQSGALGVTAVVVLVFIAISMLSRIEQALNDIWGVARGRSWFARIIQYWAVITLGPMLLLAAMALSAGPFFETTQRLSEQFPFLLLVQAMLAPVVLMLFFSAFYFLMPNTRVEWRAALIGGVVVGWLLYLTNLFRGFYVVHVVLPTQLWGSLGTVPIFLIGLYFSWIILLFGAQVAYAYQNRRTYFQAKEAEHVHERGREFVAFRIMALIGERFEKGLAPPTITQIAESLSVPSRLVSLVMKPLLERHLVVESAAEKSEIAYVPGRPLEKINCEDILDAMRAGIGHGVSTRDEPARRQIEEEFDKILEAERETACHITLADLVRKRQG